MEYYRNKVVWITGASSGLGRAMAALLAAAGARLILSSRREEALRELAAEFPGGEIRILPFDLADRRETEKAAARVAELFGPVEILINNGGVSQRAPAAETDPAVTDRIMAVNFAAPVILTRAVLPEMIRRNSGHILTVTSTAGKFGTPLRSSYSASKMALHGYFDSLRAEVWSSGIRVTLAVPGFVRTGISPHALTAGGEAYGIQDRNQEEGMDPESCARIILKKAAAGRREIPVARNGRLMTALFLNRFFPGLLARILRTAEVT